MVRFVQATKIHLSNSTTGVTATGVQFLVNSTLFSANATKEVILAASTVKTPQLLELSGIGNWLHIESLGITPMIDLPGVGENLQVRSLYC